MIAYRHLGCFPVGVWGLNLLNGLCLVRRPAGVSRLETDTLFTGHGLCGAVVRTPPHCPRPPQLPACPLSSRSVSAVIPVRAGVPGCPVSAVSLVDFPEPRASPLTGSPCDCTLGANDLCSRRALKPQFSHALNDAILGATVQFGWLSMGDLLPGIEPAALPALSWMERIVLKTLRQGPVCSGVVA